MPDQLIPRQLNGPVEVARYVASLATELAEMARQARFGALAYLLEMVRLEAENLNRQARDNKE